MEIVGRRLVFMFWDFLEFKLLVCEVVYILGMVYEVISNKLFLKKFVNVIVVDVSREVGILFI